MPNLDYSDHKVKLPIVRVISYVDPPLANDCFNTYPYNETCVYPGYEVEYIYTVLNGMLRHPVKWIMAGNLNEVIEALDNGTADVAGTSIVLENKYTEKWGFPPPAFQYDSLALLVRERYVSQSQIFVLLRSFTWDLWLSIMAFSLAFLAVRKFSKKFRLNTDFAQNFATKTFRYITHSLRANVFYSVWFFAVSLLLNFYSNLIAVDLVAPDRVKMVPFKNLAELGAKLLSKDCQFIMLEKYADYPEMMDNLVNPKNSIKPWSTLFAQAYKANHPRVMRHREDMVNAVLNDSCSIGIDWSTMGTFYNTRYCDIRIMSFPDELPMFGYTFYSSDQQLTPVMSSVIVSHSLLAYTTYLNEKYLSKNVPVECATTMAIAVNAVTLQKMQDCFFFLTTGLVLALIMLIYQKGTLIRKNKGTFSLN